MPRPRGSEVVQKQSSRVAVPLRSSSSDSDPSRHRPVTERSPKVGDRRSPQSSGSSEPLSQKNLGTRITGLENQLGQAQEELKILKEQLTLAETAKKEAQVQLQKKKKATKTKPEDFDNDEETDVFEVPVETIPDPIKEEEEAHPSFEDLALREKEINALKEEITDKEKRLVVIGEENESLKTRLDDAALEVSACQAKEAEMSSKLSQLGKELEASQGDVADLKEKLADVEGAKVELENEMKKLRVQTEQWRKAADAAAAVLNGTGDINGRILSDRCGSMDKHFGGAYDPRYGSGFVGSPGFGDDLEDGYGKRKSSGMRKIGDLWKKKGGGQK